MVFIVGASSLRNAIDIALYELQRFLRRFCFAVPGLSLNPWSRKPLKRLQYLLQKGTLSKKFNIVIWHDIINNTLTKHPSKNNRASRIDKLLSLIEQFKPRLAAIVYTARSSAPNILEQLRNSQVVTIDIRNRLLSTRKRRDISIVEDIGCVHPPAYLQLKFLSTVLNNSKDLRCLAQRKRGYRKRPSSKKRKKAQVESQPTKT